MRKRSLSGARFERASDDSLLIYFNRADEARGTGEILRSEISLNANEKVRKLLQLLRSQPIDDVRNLNPAYRSLLVKFDTRQWRHEDLEEKLRDYLERMDDVELPPARSMQIPVCYGGEHGPDLDDVAQRKGISPEQAIELHASTTYLVYFIGFVPGFAYLGELSERLATPRLPTPRRKVPAGSVAIAGNQTGVYPFETPGGWRLLGRTPLAMFDARREAFSFLSIGDHVKFKPISIQQFAELSAADHGAKQGP